MAKKPQPEVIRFQAEVFKIATLIDGGMRITIDSATLDAETIVALFNAKQPGVLLEIAAVPLLSSLTNGEKNTDRRTARSPLDLAGG